MRQVAAVLTVLAAISIAACSESQGIPTSPSAVVSSAGTMAKPQSDIPVTTSIQDVDSQGLPSDTFSDGLGAYTNGAGGVRSVLAASAYNNLKFGDWQFDAIDSPTRGVGHRFDEEDAVQTGDSHYLVPAQPPYWGAQVLKTKLQVECTFANKSMATMAAGSTITCGLIRHFVTTAGINYGLQSSPDFTGFPETTDVQITCTAANSSGCNDWYIDPIGLDRAVARLVLQGSKAHQTKIHVGDFYLRFRIRVTR